MSEVSDGDNVLPEPAAAEAVKACLAAYSAGSRPVANVERNAVKYLLALLTAIAPGHSVEVRVPPYAAVQAIAGIRHRRGTPPATVECGARTWIELGAGSMTWDAALSSGVLTASGERSDLSKLLPLIRADSAS